jgi:hypothetical protein
MQLARHKTTDDRTYTDADRHHRSNEAEHLAAAGFRHITRDDDKTQRRNCRGAHCLYGARQDYQRIRILHHKTEH